MKKNFFIAIIILILSITANIGIINADSGFDTNYDSGSSSSGISGGSSSSDSYYDSHGSSSNYIGGNGTLPYVDFLNDHPVLFIILSTFILLYIVFIFLVILKKIIN